MKQVLAALGPAIDDSFPAAWRGRLPKGDAAAAVNGPHSCTARWLHLARLYSAEEFTACFVPDAGDSWFQNIALRFNLVVRLGRVDCSAPPGLRQSTPRGGSALLVGHPLHVQEAVRDLAADLRRASKKARPEIEQRLDALLPAVTRRVMLEHATYRVPLWTRPKAGVQYAMIAAGNAAESETIDLGLQG